MSIYSRYSQNKIFLLEEFLKDNNIYVKVINKNKKLNSANLLRYDIVVKYIEKQTSFLPKEIDIKEKLRYFLYEKHELHTCIMCETHIHIDRKTCSKKCETAWFSINPQTKESLRKAIIIKQNTIDSETGLSKLQISARKSVENRKKKGGGKIIFSETHKNNIKEGKNKIDPETGLSSAKTAGIKLSNTIKSSEKEIKNRSDRMKKYQNEIIFYNLIEQKYITRGELNSILLAEDLKNTFDEKTGLSKNQIRANKTGMAKRKNRPKEEYARYTQLVQKFTNIAIRTSDIKNIEKRSSHNNNKNAYHIDHMVSIYEGFHNNIPPYIIGSHHNLKVIPWKENISKSSRSSIDIEDLCDLFFGIDL